MSTIPSWDDGAIGSPPPPPAECEPAVASTTVNPGNFQSAIAGLGSGKTIVLAPGNYPALVLSGKAYGGATIKCAEPGKCNFGSSKLTGVSGLTIDGITVRGGQVGVDIWKSHDVTVRCSTFVCQESTAILSRGNGSNIVADYNVISCDKTGCQILNGGLIPGGRCGTLRDGSPIAWMDYGVRVHETASAYIRNNIFGSMTNHWISLKNLVGLAHITGNMFNGCGRACINLGQQPSSTCKGDQGSGTAVVSSNTFTGKAQVGVTVNNIRRVTITGNDFSRFVGPGPKFQNRTAPMKPISCPLLGTGMPPNKQVTFGDN